MRRTVKRTVGRPRTIATPAVRNTTVGRTTKNVTATSLKNVLSGTINSILDGTLDVQKANSVVGASRAIVSIAKLELDFSKKSGRKNAKTAAFLN